MELFVVFQTYNYVLQKPGHIHAVLQHIKVLTKTNSKTPETVVEVNRTYHVYQFQREVN